MCGDVESNPGPINTNKRDLSIYHWNLNGLAAHNYVKVSLVSTYLSMNSIDIMFLSETFLDSSFDTDDPELSIDGYQLERADHPNDTKESGVCVYYKENLPLRIRNDLSLLQECLVCEIKVDRKKCFVTGLYRSPSQTSDQFLIFKQRLDDTLTNIDTENPYISILTGDFNGRCSNWWSDDTDNQWGVDIDSLTSFHGLCQLIDCPTPVSYTHLRAHETR